jgi:hypothetical protein
LDKKSRIRLAAGLWLTAAALAFAAAVVTYTRRGEIKVELLAAAVFLAAMGFGVLRRSRRAGV